ncbi:MAG: type VII toxin-antitoxin system HepT family RNase toxin [Lentisphaeria bacterium]
MPIEQDDVLLNKAAIIERCIRRIRQEYAANPELDNYTHVDAMILNIERACQATIDMAMHVVTQKRLGMPQSSAEAFRLLSDAGVISTEMEKHLRAMTGFRNIAVHQYQRINTDILAHIAIQGWQDMVEFCSALGLRIDAN